MPTAPLFRKSALLLPIVFAIGALMVLPGAAVLVSSSGTFPGLSDTRTSNDAGASPGSNLPAEISSPSSIFAGLPAAISKAPWIESLDHQGPTLKPLTSLPNLHILKDPPSSPSAQVNPLYTGQPAPLGLADFGLGATTYSYNTSHIVGELTLNNPPNVTDPGSANVIEPSANGEHEGDVGSFYEFGVQLNTVTTNISIPGSDSGFFWTQNVVNWNDTGIHFVDDTFNFSNPSTTIFPGTIFSGCNNNTAGVDKILITYGGVFQCVGGTIPLSPAAYPVTLQLYNNATLNAQNRTQVAYGYRIIEAGIGAVFTGVSDVVVFNNPAAPGAAPANKPGFSINGFDLTPFGFFRDAELVLVGDIGGDNSVFRSINGTINLLYSNASSGGFQHVPSAYDFGSDTGETSTGFTGTWNVTTHTENINQGPSFLYGLWNALPYLRVAPGSLHVAGTITPSYGFVFVDNIAPDVFGSNMSWMPTNDSGGFNAYLPPLGSPWTTTYYVQAFAAGSAEVNTTVIAATTSLSIVLPLAPGVLRAPLYMFGNAQAASLAANVTGSSTPPYDFNGLVDNVNFTFNHFNDFTYPDFELFMAQGVTQPIIVNNTTQGEDTAFGNFYFIDYGSPAETGIIFPVPFIVGIKLPGFTSVINIFNGFDDQISNESLPGERIVDGNVQGGQIALWGDTDAAVSDVTSTGRSMGVFVGESVDTTVQDVAVASGGIGITDMASLGTMGQNIAVSGGFGVQAFSSSGDTFSQIDVTDGGTGVVTGADFGASAAFEPYYYLHGTVGLTVSDVNVTNDSLGANVTLSSDTSLSLFSGYDPLFLGSAGIELDSTVDTTVDSLAVTDAVFGLLTSNAVSTTVTDVKGIDLQAGLVFEESAFVIVSNANVTLSGLGVDGLGLFDGTFDNIGAYQDGVGLQLIDSSGNVVTLSSFVDCTSYGVVVSGGSGNTIYDNSFIGDNGAGSTYNAANIQAFSDTGADNSFDLGTIGNYWSDWHTYNPNGTLAPYPMANDNFDFYPLAGPAGTVAVDFFESGLSSGLAWSVTLNGATESTTNSELVFYVVAGEYAFTSGTVTGYRVSPSSGTVTASGASVSEDVTYVAQYTVTVTESGLTTGTSWSATVGGTTVAGTTASLTLSAGSGTYDFQISGVSGYSESPASGTITVGTSAYTLLVTFTPVVVLGSVTVSVTESGLTSGTSWSATVNGVTNTGTTSALTFTVTASSTYDYQISPVTGYTESPASGTITVGTSAYSLLVTFTATPLPPTVTVTVTESGLPSGTSWSATVDGITDTGTTAGSTATLSFTVAPGTYAYQIGSVAGFAVSPSTGTVTPSSGTYNLLVTFTQVTYPVTITENGLAAGMAWTATLDGVSQTTVGNSITFYLPDGSYTYSITAVSGYTLTGGSGSLTVNGAPAGTSGAFAPTTTPSLVSTSTYNMGFEIALIIGVIALVIAVVALLVRGRQPPAAKSNPPAAWSEGSGPSSTGGSGGKSGGS